MPIPQRNSLPVVIHLPDSFFPTGLLNNVEKQKMAVGEARFCAVQRLTDLTTWFLVGTSRASCVSGQHTVEPTQADDCHAEASLGS
jgi:hypothetical protein